MINDQIIDPTSALSNTVNAAIAMSACAKVGVHLATEVSLVRLNVDSNKCTAGERNFEEVRLHESAMENIVTLRGV